MRIFFERTGGFMGIRLASQMDTTAMPQKEAIELQQLVMTAANYFEKLEIKKEPASTVDTFQYRLVVEDGEEQKEYEVTEETAPNEIRPLLRQLTVLARSYPADPAS
ncbi:MAG: protealysin inhibitor emfourin [Anaerolineae bacterium]